MIGEPLTDNQQKWLHVLSPLCSSLSFAGSITVMQIVRNSKRKKGRLSTYDRLLFGISACDLVNSIATAADSYLEPRDDDYSMVWAFGNDATCKISGFFGVFYITTWLYHAAISLYYVLLIRFGFRDENIGWKIELPLHLVAILWPILCGAAGFILNGFGPTITSYGCYISNWPSDCIKSSPENPLEEGEVECDGTIFKWTTIPATFTPFAIILLCNLVIYCHVRSTVLKTTRNSVLQFDNKTSDPTSPSLSRKLSRRQSESAIISTGQLERIRAVRNQSLLYFLITTTTLIPLWVQKNLSQNNPSLTRETESSIYVVIVLRAIFTPISGFFNLIIFCRPTYIRYRRNFPEASRIEAFRRTVEAGTGRSEGTRRRERSLGTQNGWWRQLWKRSTGRQAHGTPTTPVVVVVPPIVGQYEQQDSEEGKAEEKKSSDVTTHPNVVEDVELDNKDPTSTTSTTPPHEELDQGRDVQLIPDGSWHSDQFPSHTSINFVMDDGSSDQKSSSRDGEDEEVSSIGVLPSRPPHGSHADEGRQYSSIGVRNRRRLIVFDSSCIEAISTTSTVEA